MLFQKTLGSVGADDHRERLLGQLEHPEIVDRHERDLPDEGNGIEYQGDNPRSSEASGTIHYDDTFDIIQRISSVGKELQK